MSSRSISTSRSSSTSSIGTSSSSSRSSSIGISRSSSTRSSSSGTSSAHVSLHFMTNGRQIEFTADTISQMETGWGDCVKVASHPEMSGCKEH